MRTIQPGFAPGRYQVLGGPGGRTMVRKIMRDVGNGHVLDNGRTYVYGGSYADSWVVLATFRVRGQRVTYYGALDAVMRVWSLG